MSNQYERHSVKSYEIDYGIGWTLSDNEVEERIIDKVDYLVSLVMPILENEMTVEEFSNKCFNANYHSLPHEFQDTITNICDKTKYPDFDSRRKAMYQFWYPIIRKKIETERL